MSSSQNPQNREAVSADQTPALGALAGLLFRCNPPAAFKLSKGTSLAPHVAGSSLSKISKVSVRPRTLRPLRPVMGAPVTRQSLLQTVGPTYKDLANKGLAKARMSGPKTLTSNIMAGFQIGIGGLVCLTVCGNIPGVPPGFSKFIFGALFPVCLMLVLNTGTQLFTGNAASMSAAYFENKIRKRDVSFNWILACIGNFIGCGSVALIAAVSGLLTGGTAEMAAGVGIAKAGLGAGTFGQMLVRGIMGNYLVNMGVFLGMMAKDMMGRYIGIFIPLSAFVICGFEHSVTNFFLLPAALLAGAPITFKDVLLKNLIPVAIGNTISAVVLVSAYFSYAFGRLGGFTMIEDTGTGSLKRTSQIQRWR